jgi:HSP20 family protein
LLAGIGIATNIVENVACGTSSLLTFLNWPASGAHNGPREEKFMPAVKSQNQSSAQSRTLARPQDNYPADDSSELNPFALMRRFSEEMDRAFGRGFGPSRWMDNAMWSPAVEVRKHDHTLDITAELPGIKKEDLKVEFTDDSIVIEGEKRRENESDEGGIHRAERSYGHFYRLIPLSGGADPQKAQAEFKDGVLRVHVPISEERRKQREIPING